MKSASCAPKAAKVFVNYWPRLKFYSRNSQVPSFKSKFLQYIWLQMLRMPSNLISEASKRTFKVKASFYFCFELETFSFENDEATNILQKSIQNFEPY